MLKYFVYCRKSTEDKDRQILSIGAQLFEMRSLALQQGLVVVETFTETKSAKESGRPIFDEMMRRVSLGEANGILAWKLDRLARNFDDGGKIIGLLQRGAIREIRTFEKTYLPSDNVLMIAVELGMANQYVRDLSVNVKRGLREKVRRGVFCGKAPLGYYNEPRLRTIEPDPVLFPKMKSVLESFSRGEHSLTSLQREMSRVGLFGGRANRPLYLSALTKILRNPFYYGAFLFKGELHQGVHQPMISKQTHDNILTQLVAHGKPRKGRQMEKFLFLDFATCGCCGFSITGERQIKKSGRQFDYYRCTHKSRQNPCTERSYVRADDFAAEVRRNMELVVLPDDWKERFLARIEGWESDESKVRQERVASLRSEIAVIKAKIDRLNSAFADGGLGLDEFKELKNPLVARKVELEGQILGFEKTTTTWLEPLKNWILEANTGGKRLKEENWLEMKAFLKKVGSNRLLRAKKLTVAFKTPWDVLAKTNLAARERVEKNPMGSQRVLECTRGDSNSCFEGADCTSSRCNTSKQTKSTAKVSDRSQFLRKIDGTS